VSALRNPNKKIFADSVVVTTRTNGNDASCCG
jgi:hypothetical protein